MAPEFDVVVVAQEPDKMMLGRLLKHCTRKTRITLCSNSALPLCSDFYHREFNAPENAGWVRAANAGLSLAMAPHVVLCNDDIEVRTSGWLEKLREPFLEDSKVAAVGPRTTTESAQGRLKKGPWRVCVDSRHQVRINGRPVRQGDYDPDHHWCIGSWPLSFFCVMFSQEALLDVGLLDLGLADGYGGDDDDWQRRAWERGWRFAYQPGVLVEHEGNATFGERKAELQGRNVEYLRRKWGRG